MYFSKIKIDTNDVYIINYLQYVDCILQKVNSYTQYDNIQEFTYFLFIDYKKQQDQNEYCIDCNKSLLKNINIKF